MKYYKTETANMFYLCTLALTRFTTYYLETQIGGFYLQDKQSLSSHSADLF